MSTYIVVSLTKHNMSTGSIEVEANDEKQVVKLADIHSDKLIAVIEIHPDDLSAHERGDFARTKIHLF